MNFRKLLLGGLVVLLSQFSPIQLKGEKYEYIVSLENKTTDGKKFSKFMEKLKEKGYNARFCMKEENGKNFWYTTILLDELPTDKLRKITGYDYSVEKRIKEEVKPGIDLSTPEKSYFAFLEAMSNEDRIILEKALPSSTPQSMFGYPFDDLKNDFFSGNYHAKVLGKIVEQSKKKSISPRVLMKSEKFAFLVFNCKNDSGDPENAVYFSVKEDDGWKFDPFISKTSVPEMFKWQIKNLRKALEIYKAKKECYPKMLEELIPEIDTGELHQEFGTLDIYNPEFKYNYLSNTKDYLIYSCGPNGIDERGLNDDIVSFSRKEFFEEYKSSLNTK